MRCKHKTAAERQPGLVRPGLTSVSCSCGLKESSGMAEEQLRALGALQGSAGAVPHPAGDRGTALSGQGHPAPLLQLLCLGLSQGAFGRACRLSQQKIGFLHCSLCSHLSIKCLHSAD